MKAKTFIFELVELKEQIRRDIIGNVENGVARLIFKDQIRVDDLVDEKKIDTLIDFWILSVLYDYHLLLFPKHYTNYSNITEAEGKTLTLEVHPVLITVMCRMFNLPNKYRTIEFREILIKNNDLYVIF